MFTPLRVSIKTCIIFFSLPLILFGQNFSFSGKVLSTSKNPLFGANIFVINQNQVISTNERGVFSFKNLKSEILDIEIRLIGYKTFKGTINLKEEHQKEFILEESLYRLKGVETTANQNRIIQKESPTISKSFNPLEVQYKAGGGEDVLRALLSVPGISSQNDMSVQLIVRGSNPEQNLMLMDGIEIFNPYRFYGFVSMFNPEIVNDINLIPGGFSAKYSDRLSAVIDVTGKDGLNNNIGEPRFYTNFNLTNMNVVGEIKLKMREDEEENLINEEGDQSFGALVVAFRRTYYDLFFKPIIKALDFASGDFILPNFTDFQFKFSIQPSYNNKIIFNTLINRDQTDLTNFKLEGPIEKISINDVTINHLASLTWISNHAEGVIGQYSLSHYQYGGRNRGNISQNSAFSIGMNIKEDEYKKLVDSLKNLGIDLIPLLQSSAEYYFNFDRTTFKTDFIIEHGKNNLLEMGFLFDDINSDIGIKFNLDPRRALNRQSTYHFTYIPSEFNSEVKTFRIGAFLQDKINILNDLKIQPSIRYDYYKIVNKSYISPRFSFSYQFLDQFILKGGIGIYYQSPGYEKLFNTNPEVYNKTNMLNLSEKYALNLEAERATHYNLSLDIDLFQEYNFRVETYYKDFKNLIYPKIVKGTSYQTININPFDYRNPDSWLTPFPVVDDSVTTIPVNSGTGISKGIEFILRKEITADNPNFYGWIAYSYASAKRNWNSIEYPFNYERTHNFNLMLGYRLGDWLDLNLSFQYGTGFPVTEPIGIKPRIFLMKDTINNSVYAKIDSDINGVAFEPDFGKIDNLNRKNLPDYHRLDIRFTTYTKWFGWEWRLYLDIINVYNHQNVVAKSFYVDRNTLKIQEFDTKVLPFLPSIGITIYFNKQN